MKCRYLSIFLILLILSIGAVSAQEDAASDDSIAIAQDSEILSVSEFVIDDGNYDSYFDNRGTILENSNISDGDTIKLGNVSNKDFVIDKLLTVTSNSSGDVLTNVSFYFLEGSDNSTISNLNFVNHDAVENAISVVGASNVAISDNIIDVHGIENSYDLYAISACFADNLTVESNVVTYVGKTNGTGKNMALYVAGSNNVEVMGNYFGIAIPAGNVDWATGFSCTEGITFDSCDDLVFSENHVDLVTNDSVGSYPTVYAVHISDSDNANVANNEIHALGNITYLYGFRVGGNNFLVSENDIEVYNDNYGAWGIEVAPTASGVIDSNHILVESNNVSYGVSSSFDWITYDCPSVNYTNNHIDVYAHATYAMELFGSGVTVIDCNHIDAEGNYTLGIASAIMYDGSFVITNNDIYACGINDGQVDTGDMVPAITVGILTMAESQIQNNAITSAGNWSIINSAYDGEITGNYLVSKDLLGDNSVDDRMGITVEDNIPTADAINYNLTNDTFFLFFDDEGYLRSNITAESLTFIGEFSELTPWNTIDRPVKLLSDNATLHDMEFIIISDDVVVDGFTFISNNSRASIISIEQSNNISVVNNDFFVLGVEDDYNMVIDVIGSDDVLINNNTIMLDVKTNESYHNHAIDAHNSTGLTISENEIVSLLPALDIDWENGEVYSVGVCLDVCDNVVLAKNHIHVLSSGETGLYPTIYGVHIAGENASILENKIDTFEAPYGYAVVIAGENFNITNNTIVVGENGTYACGIDVESNSLGIIDDNLIYATAEESSYGIYTANWVGDVKADIINNTIFAEANSAFAMSLSGSEATVNNNNISVDGNFTTGIASVFGMISITNNTIIANGSNVGTPLGYDSMGIETTGVHIVKGNANITENFIKTTGEFAVDAKGTGQVTDNHLLADVYTGDASVDNVPADTYVANNTPAMARAVISAEDVVMYYKNGTRYVVVLTDQLGNPLANRTVTLTINGASYNRTTDENGSASLAINLNSGLYTASAFYAGEDNLTANTTVENTIEVLPTVFGENVVKIFRNDTQYYATFLDGQGNPLANGTEVTFNINGVMYKRYINGTEGKARLNINLPQGEYIITAINPVNGEMAANNITVLASIANNTDLVKYFKNESQYVVTVLGADGNPVGANETVTFNINGVFYKRMTNESGQAKLTINLEPGDYIITAEYNECRVSNNITVLPVLNATDLNKKYGTPDPFVVTLVDGQGMPYAGQNVTFNINGVFYTKTTDDVGNAKLNINLMAGEYIITSSYNGANIANKVTVTA